jgi:hypothetical protein
MSKRVLILGKDPLGKAKYANVTESGDLKVQLSGTTMSLFGATIEERPSADSVEVGTTFTLTNAELDTWISNGTDWVELPPQLKVIRGINDLIVEEGADLNG